MTSFLPFFSVKEMFSGKELGKAHLWRYHEKAQVGHTPDAIGIELQRTSDLLDYLTGLCEKI